MQRFLPTHSQASQQLVAERLCLSNGTQPTGGNLLSIQLTRGEKGQNVKHPENAALQVSLKRAIGEYQCFLS